ncbi:MAG: hypothetical protein O2931_00360 [Planctomycetota bacterium]|nr:hypothetical protein [Planctomycetota bacterium]MDA1177226.1 hypothetical protein [Planctomycetota bacterium]
MNKKLVIEFVALQRLASAFVAGCVLTTTGCVKIGHEVRYTEPGRALNRIEDPYYHSPQTGRIVMRPKKAAQYCYSEPAFYGYEATCWQRWPDGWVGCPCQEEEIAVATPIRGPEQLPAAEAETPSQIHTPPTSTAPSTPPAEQPSPSDRGSYDDAYDPTTIPVEPQSGLADATRTVEVPRPSQVETANLPTEIAPKVNQQATNPSPAPIPNIDSSPPTQRRAMRRNIPSLPVAGTESMPKSSNEKTIDHGPAGIVNPSTEPARPTTVATTLTDDHQPESAPVAIQHLSDPLEEVDPPVREWNVRANSSRDAKPSFAANESAEVPSLTLSEKTTASTPLAQSPNPHATAHPPIEAATTVPTTPFVAILTGPIGSASSRTERIISDSANQPNASELRFAATQGEAAPLRHRWSPEPTDPDTATLVFRQQSANNGIGNEKRPASRPALSARPSPESKNEIRVR